jgi:hypothetical protein
MRLSQSLIKSLIKSSAKPSVKPKAKSAAKITITSYLFIGLLLGIETTILTTPAQAQSILEKLGKLISPPTRRGTASGRLRGGGTRSNCAPKPATESLMAIMPKDAYGTTVESNPTFWFYLPAYWFVPSAATSTTELKQVKRGVFMLLDDRGKPMLKQAITVDVPEQSSLARFQLPQDQALWVEGRSLEVGKRYNWFFSVVCDAKQPARNPTVSGWVERVAKPADIDEQLQKVSAADRYTVYVQNDNWFESLTSLAENRQTAPKSWEALFNQLGLAQKANEPIVVLEPTKK